MPTNKPLALYGTPKARALDETGSHAAPTDGFPSADGLSAHDGLVMHHPRVHAVYWGSAFGSEASGLNATAATLNNFFSALLPSRYFDFLSEYGVAQPVYSGSVWLPYSGGPFMINGFDDMGPILSAWLDGKVLPEIPGPNEFDLLYVIFLPSEITLAPALKACAYHNWAFYAKPGVGKQNLIYAVIETANHTQAQITVSTTHELAEAFTDRNGDGWFNAVGEIGDFCSTCGSGFLRLNGFAVASYWRQSVGRCLSQDDLTPPPLPPAKLEPLVQLTPPPHLGRSGTFSVSASDPATGAALTGTAKVFQPQVGGRSALVASFPVPGATPRPLLLRPLPGARGSDAIFPHLEFEPADPAHYSTSVVSIEG